MSNTLLPVLYGWHCESSTPDVHTHGNYLGAVFIAAQIAWCLNDKLDIGHGGSSFSSLSTDVLDLDEAAFVCGRLKVTEMYWLLYVRAVLQSCRDVVEIVKWKRRRLMYATRALGGDVTA